MSNLFDISSLAMIPTAYKDGKLYSVRPIPEYGSEKIINGSFDTDTAWTKGTGWTISGGTASCDGTQTSTTNLNNTLGNGLVNGKIYRVVYTISGYAGGSIRIKLGNTGYGVYHSANGTYTQDLVAGVTTFPTAQFNADANFVGSIDNVSVQEITKSGDFTFSRGSNLAATRVDVNGLIEKGRANYILHSQDIDNAYWNKLGMSVTANQATAPNGTTTADLIDDGTATGNHFIEENEIIGGGIATASIHAKYVDTQYLVLAVYDTAYRVVVFDIQNGTIGNQNLSTLIPTIEDLGGGWYRCAVTHPANTRNNPYIAFGLRDDDVAAFNTGAGSNRQAYVWGAQLEQGLVATDYIETGASTAQAGILEDMPRLDYSGSCPALLLEPQRSNLITHSELLTDSSWTNQLGSTIDVGQASSVSGYNDAWKLNKASGTFKSLRLQKTLASDNYSLTWFLKAGTISIAEFRFDGGLGAQFIDFDLSNGTHGTNANLSNIEMTPFNDGWYRCSASINTNLTNVHLYVDDASVSSGAGYIYAQYPQLEAGSYATSYIPTYGASVTRSGDDCNKTGISDLIGQTEGAFFTEFKIENLENLTTRRLLTLSNGNSNTRIVIYLNSLNKISIYIVDGGVAQWDYTGTILTAGTYKIAVGYAENDFVLYVNGSLEASDSSGSVPATNRIDIGNQLGSNVGEQPIKQLSVFKTRLTNTELASLTTL